MKDGLKYLIGKRIAGVVVAKSQRSPQNQVFLVFADGSRFEFWGDNFSCCGGLDDGKTIQRYVDSNHGEVVRVYDEPLGMVAAPETLLMVRMKRDLEAWTLAKAAIVKAQQPSPRPSPKGEGEV